MPKQKYSSEFKVRTVLDGLKSPDGVAAHRRRLEGEKELRCNADGGSMKN